MTLKKCFFYGLALMIGLSLASANMRADTPARSVPYDGYTVAYSGYTTQESIFVAALNEYRATRGLNPVAVCSALSSDCRRWSSSMRQREHLSHDPAGGMEICAQITQECGLSALRAWQKSSAHNAILLSPRIDTIGIGSDGNWWTMRGRQGGGRHTVFRPTDVQEIPDGEEVAPSLIDNENDSPRTASGMAFASSDRGTTGYAPVGVGTVRYSPFRLR